MTVDSLTAPLLSYNAPNDHLPKSRLETIPDALYPEITKFLPARESWIFGKGLSKTISKHFDSTELEEAWEKNPAVRRVYEKYLHPASKWTDLKRILLHDLSIAQQMAVRNSSSITLPEHRYLNCDSPLFHKYFHEFEQIAHIISQNNFLDSPSSGCCSCLDKWEWSVPIRNGEFCTPGVIGKTICTLNTISGIALSCLTCCLPIPSSAFYGAAAASTALPCCCTLICQDRTKQMPEALKRFKAILELDLPGKLRNEILNLPQLLREDRIDRDLFIQRVIEIMQTAESIQTRGALPGIEALHERLKNRPVNLSRSLSLDDLCILNQARFIASKALNRNFRNPLSNEERALIQNFNDSETSTIQSLFLRHLTNVNHPEFLPLLLDPNLDLNHFRLLLNAGLDLENIPIDALTPRLLFQLLDEGVFVNHPRILDYLSKDYRYDLAFILFLYGYESPKINRQLKHDALVKFGILKKIQQPLRTGQNSTAERSLLFRETLKNLLNNAKNVSMPQFCDRITDAKNQLERRLRAEDAAIEEALHSSEYNPLYP